VEKKGSPCGRDAKSVVHRRGEEYYILLSMCRRYPRPRARNPPRIDNLAGERARARAREMGVTR